MAEDSSTAAATVVPLVAHAHPPRRRLEELDGLRGILALFVVLFHLQEPLALASAQLTRALPMVLEAWFAVDVFFVMSGFVMAYVYGSTFSRRVGWPDFRAFFVARIARLYPVHLAALAALALVLVPRLYDAPDFLEWSGRYSWGSGLASLLMLHSPWVSHRSWNFPSWSISAEWHAYLVFPFLVRPVLRARETGLVGLVALSCAGVFVLYWLDLPPDRYPTNGPLVLLRVLPLFIIGMALFPLHRAFGARFRHGVPALGLVALIITLLNVAALAPFAVFLIPPLVLAALNAPVLRDPLGSAPARFLGAISYSLYMTHALIMLLGYPLVSYAVRLSLGESAEAESAPLQWMVLVGALLGALLLGALTWRFIEVPARARVARLLSPPSAAAEREPARAAS